MMDVQTSKWKLTNLIQLDLMVLLKATYHSLPSIL